jgi:hypothetical protein
MAITKEDAERMKAYITARFMGVMTEEYTVGGCETCGYGGTTYYRLSEDSPEDILFNMRGMVDGFLESEDNQ